MTQSTRKLLGTVLLLASILGFAIAATAVYANYLAGSPWWILLPYFAVAGMLWFLPAAAIIRWMSRPDRN